MAFIEYVDNALPPLRAGPIPGLPQADIGAWVRPLLVLPLTCTLRRTDEPRGRHEAQAHQALLLAGSLPLPVCSFVTREHTFTWLIV
jgi:hypothetical protein